MVVVVQIALCLLALAMLVPVCVLLLQVLMSLPRQRELAMPAGERPSVAVLIPAHDEALLIASTLRAIAAQLASGDRMLVVADNCSDDTAAIAVAAGAEVIERCDRERRGKGYALDFGVRHLERQPPEVVLIIDADCDVDAGAIERLARVCLKTGRPVQALYLMRSPANAGIKTHIAEFASLVKNQVRALGYLRLGLPCQLMGTGMAFPWAVMRSAALATGHIVEDLQLGIDLARARTPALFCPQARVTSYFPATAQGIAGQRTRWEHGHLGVIVALAPRLLLEAVRTGDGNLLALALDLCVPPLALLLLLVTAVFAASGALLLWAHVAVAFRIAALVLIMLGGAVALSWTRYGRQVISLGALAYAPFYALWKLPVYLKFLGGRQVEWVRSKRDKP